MCVNYTLQWTRNEKKFGLYLIFTYDNITIHTPLNFWVPTLQKFFEPILSTNMKTHNRFSFLTNFPPNDYLGYSLGEKIRIEKRFFIKYKL